MEYPKFIWAPDLGASCEEQPFVNVTKFGDGYEARVGYLINSTPKNWTVTFTTNLETHTAIKNFLRARNATENFEWKSPDGDVNRYVCRSWTTKQSSFGVYEVSATFEQVFE
ncbi:phage tail protein [Parasutterella muris]|uniref:phage tail protein n=1 Tax=Parasutterella muris TaxID=2565572 RepID=UPI00203B2E07|nr:phage tail protein [Parasutterella muris]